MSNKYLFKVLDYMGKLFVFHVRQYSNLAFQKSSEADGAR